MSTILYRHRQFCEEAELLRNLSPRTIKSYRDNIQIFVKYSGVTDLKQFNKDSVIRWVLHGRRERNWSPKTVHIYLGDLKQFVQWCVNNDYLTSNFIEQIPLPKIPQTKIEYFDQKECQQLIKCIENYPYVYAEEKSRALAIFATFILTGIRKAELLDLHLDDVCLKSQCMHIRKGKGRKNRTVYFNSSLTPFLATYLEERHLLNLKTPFFFASIRNDKGIDNTMLRRLFAKIQESFGKKINAHKFRHSYITHCLERRIPEHKVRSQVGHGSNKILQRYTHIRPDDLKRDMDELGSRLHCHTPIENTPLSGKALEDDLMSNYTA